MAVDLEGMLMRLQSNKGEEVTAQCWEAVVIGAGPAGAMVAREMARRDIKVLLVDKQSFPRRKVCGACFSAQALRTLESVGLGQLMPQLGSIPLNTLRLAIRGNSLSVPLRERMALSREAFDMAMIEAAIDAGVSFLSGTKAALGHCEERHREILLHHEGRHTAIRTSLVLVASGLDVVHNGGREDVKIVIKKRSFFGAGVVKDVSPMFYKPGTLYMACGRGGYVGVVRLENGRLNVAAALDPRHIKGTNSIGKTAQNILAEAEFQALADMRSLSWCATPKLTRRTMPIALHRLFFLGDAAGYGEPFTGEGIGHALWQGKILADLASRASRRWNLSYAYEWNRLYSHAMSRRQRLVRLISHVFHHPSIAGLLIKYASFIPSVIVPMYDRSVSRDVTNAPLQRTSKQISTPETGL